MSPAFIKGVHEHLPEARVTFDKFNLVAHATTRRMVQASLYREQLRETLECKQT